MKNPLILMCICTCLLVACGGTKTVKPNPSSPQASKSATSATKPGGYYLDDGPGDNPPQNIDSIPNAVPKNEPYLVRANKPYRALGASYTPMTGWQPYKERGVASWYGKRYHGKKTASGEVYDMYSMSAAHTTLPLPSYVKVSNPANGRFVIVRVNDRGPFKSNRLIDLSYAAAYQLRFASSGSTLVEVEAIDPNNAASYTTPAKTSTVPIASTHVASSPIVSSPAPNPPTTNPPASNPSTTTATAGSISAGAMQYFVQAGAFKNEANAQALTKRIQSLEIAPNAGINSVYNNSLYRLKLGPFDNKPEAEQAAAKIRKQLNLPAIIINQ